MIQEPAGESVGVLHAILLGVVEGLTEFLPVSSTGHLIVVDRLLGHSSDTMEIGIQAGAITAIAWLYRGKLLDAARFSREPGRTNLWLLISVAALPAIVLGALVHKPIEQTLMNTTVVGITTLVGGILLMMLEGFLAGRTSRGIALQRTVETLTVRHALIIGVFQTLALIPGASRSAATIAGGLLLGCTRAAAAEFSFLVGLPILYGACALKLWKVRGELHGALLRDLGIGGVVAFVVALGVVVPFVRYLQRHTFVPFAIYRIVAGVAILAWFARG